MTTAFASGRAVSTEEACGFLDLGRTAWFRRAEGAMLDRDQSAVEVSQSDLFERHPCRRNRTMTGFDIYDVDQCASMTGRAERIGLVLSGGGFRGAYQAGFLRAAEEFGLKPAALSGASVGALNATLYRYKTAAEICQYWKHSASFRAMYQVSTSGLLMRLLALWLLVPQILYRRRFYTDRYGSALMQNIADVELKMTSKPAFVTRNSGMALFRLEIAQAAVFAVVDKELISLSWASTGVVFVCLLVLLERGPAFTRLLEKKRVAVLRSQIGPRLTELIPQDSEVRSNPPEVFVAVSHVQEIFDYSHPHGWIPLSGSVGSYVSRLIHMTFGSMVPASQPTLVPAYIRLELNAIPEQLPELAATAALPLGLVVGITGREGKLFRDGGAVDNVPVRPLLSQALDRIIILDVDSKGWDRQKFQDEFVRRSRLIESSKHAHGMIEHLALKLLLRDRGAGSFVRVLREQITPTLDKYLGVVAEPPQCAIDHVRLPKGRIGLSTLYASAKSRSTMIEQGYLMGVQYFSGLSDDVSPRAV